jgi:hypothetical protein
MAQAAVVAEADKKVPLVVFKVFRSADIAMLRSVDFARLQELFGEPAASYYQLRKLEVRLNTNLVLLLLSDLIEWIDWSIYKLAARGQYIRSLIPTKEG